MNRPVRHPRFACLVLSILLVLTLLLSSCSQKSTPSSSANTTKASQITTVTDTPKPSSLSGQLIQAIPQAQSPEQREQAVKSLVQAGFSLGLIDASGQQLNTNTPNAPVSIGPDGLEVYTMLAADGAGRPLGSVIDFLQASGVVLDATQKAIDIDSLLPDIQQYVDWSFENQNDPKATLGLLLSSGPVMQIPTSAPKLSAASWISPLAGILLMADILIGIPDPAPEKADTGNRVSLAKLWTAQPVAASGLQDTAKSLQGLITVITPFLPENLKIPDMVHTILNAFALGDRIVLRTVDPDDLGFDSAQDIRSIELKPALNQGVWLAPIMMLLPSRTFLQGPEMTVTADLVSPSRALGSAAGTLYPDADARFFNQKGHNPSIELDGHRLIVSGRPPNDPVIFSVVRTLSDNHEKKAALLYATAEIKLPQLSEVLAKYDEELSKLGLLAQGGIETVLPREQVEKYFRDIESGLQVAALAYPVILLPRSQEAALSFKSEGTQISGLPNRFIPLPDGLDKTWPAQYEWVWAWGDGSPETISTRLDRPTHTYDSPGTYTIWLRARNPATKEILATVEQQLEIQELAAITERTETGISYHLFEEKDAQIPVLLDEQLSLTDYSRLNLCSFEAPEPSWSAFPNLYVTHKGQILNYAPPNLPPVYLNRTIRMKIRYANELMKSSVKYAHGQDTGTLLGNEWIATTASSKKQYDQIIQMAQTNQQSRLVENSLDENHMRFIYMNSARSELQMNNSYVAAHVERYGSCIIEIHMNDASPDDGSVQTLLNAMVDYAHNLADKAEGHAGRYIQAFDRP